MENGAEPRMLEALAGIMSSFPKKVVVDKFILSPLTENQTAEYLQYRINTVGYLKKSPFSSNQIRNIHRISGGLPGLINVEAHMMLRANPIGQRGQGSKLVNAVTPCADDRVN